jgi:hypothetical protein
MPAIHRQPKSARTEIWILLLAALPSIAGGQKPAAPNYRPQAVFSNPTAVTNAYLPYAQLKQDVLVGTEKGKPARVVRTRMPGTKRFIVAGKPVDAIIVADSGWLGGELEEVALDYYAQSDQGDVYYLGEDVDNYEKGKVVNHEGSWLYGIHTRVLGMMFPATPRVGQRYRPEEVPKITQEDDEVMSVTETVTVPAGTFQNCVRIKETLSDGAVEFKLYCANVGIVREGSDDGTTDLASHR